MPDVIVIGAGISGLTAAYALRTAGADVVVLDQRVRPGGRLCSEQVAGFLMEHGAHGIVGPAAPAEGLIGELGLDAERVDRGAGARRRYLVRGGRACGLSLQPHRFLLSSFFSVTGRLRMLLEPFVPAEHGDETVASFARRRFGGEFLDYVMDPLAAGLYAGDPEQLSMCAVFPQLKQLERRHGSVVLGALESRLPRVGQRAPRYCRARTLFSLRGGLGSLPWAIAQRLAGRVLLGQRVASLRRAPAHGYRVLVRDGAARHTLTARSVVVALPAYAAAAILDPLDPRASETLATLDHPPLAVVFLGYRADAIAHPLDGAGVLAPSAEKRNVLGILFSSTLFPGRAPPGHVALTAFVGGARAAHLVALAPAELEELAHHEVRELLGGGAAPVLARTRRWRHGLPQPGLDHARRLATIAALEGGHPGLFLTGNYFSGVSTAACIAQALQNAARVERYLDSGPARRLRAA